MGLFDFNRNVRNTRTPAADANRMFTEEFADEVLLDNYTKGVTFRTSGDNLKIAYNGLLARSGAKEVYAVVGFGSNDNWKDVRTYAMTSTDGQSFELSIPAEDNERVNIAFKDSIENWDNNSGKNYSFFVH
jgi:hypothetical protein